jgi:hypothetical protein
MDHVTVPDGFFFKFLPLSAISVKSKATEKPFSFSAVMKHTKVA